MAPRAFEFEHDGRRFSCTVEQRRSARPESWWWFVVSTEDQHRYAPFQAAKGDTESSVRDRIVAYYDDLLARRAAPAQSYWRRGPGRPTPAAGVPVTTDAAPATPGASPPRS
jgi:hypothetical protein